MPSTAGFSSPLTTPSSTYKFRGQHVGGAQYVRNGGPIFNIHFYQNGNKPREVGPPPWNATHRWPGGGASYGAGSTDADNKNWDDPALNAGVNITDTTGTTQTYAAFTAAQPQATKLWGGFGNDPGTQTPGAGFAWATPMPP